jgi:hypothetical protein
MRSPSPQIRRATETAEPLTTINDTSLVPDDLREIQKPAGRHKAIISSVASILRPGRAVQVSVQDNRWRHDSALSVPRVRAIQDFLTNLLELP